MSARRAAWPAAGRVRRGLLPVLVVPGLLAAPLASRASSTSSITLGDDVYFTMGAELQLGEGTRPDFLPVAPDFQRLAIGYWARGGYVDGETELGTQVGLELEMFLGWTPKETDPWEQEDEVGFSFRVGLPLRFATTAVPLLTAALVHLSLELEAGHARWWSSTARLNVIAGLRLTSEIIDGFGLELDYAVVPFVVNGAPQEIAYDRFEHRVMLSGGYGPLGLGVELTLSHDLVRASPEEAYQSVGDRALSFIVAYRMGN